MSHDKSNSLPSKNNLSRAKADSGPSLIVPSRLDMTRANFVQLIDQWIVPRLGMTYLEQAKPELEAAKVGNGNAEEVVQNVVLECGLCRHSMIHTEHGYGCSQHKVSGTCENKWTIRAERLEDQLIGAIVRAVSEPEMVEHTIQKFQEHMDREIEGELRQIEKNRLDAPQLKAELAKLNSEGNHIVDAIAASGPHWSPDLLKKLEEVEKRREVVKASLENQPKPALNPSPAQNRKFVISKFTELKDLLLKDRAAAKQALRQFVPKLKLRPVMIGKRNVFRVEAA